MTDQDESLSCPICGTLVAQDDKECPNCGREFREGEP